METETKTQTPVKPGVYLSHLEDADLFTITVQAREVTALRSELQAIVQAAYDQHGILPTPDLDREVARIAEAHPGLCRCGQPWCSDRDTLVREFADRWGQSLRGRA